MDSSSNQRETRESAKFEFKWLKTNELKPNPWNPNRLSPELARKLSTEIRKSGMILPIVVRTIPAKGGADCPASLEYQIIDGEHRWLIAQELGMESLPCIVVALDDAEAKIKTLQLNRLRGEDDPELLARLLRELEIELSIEEMCARLPFDEVEIEQSMELLDLKTKEEVRKKLEQEMSHLLQDRVFSLIVSDAEKATIEYAIHLFNSRSQTNLRPGTVLAKICENWLTNLEKAS